MKRFGKFVCMLCALALLIGLLPFLSPRAEAGAIWYVQNFTSGRVYIEPVNNGSGSNRRVLTVNSNGRVELQAMNSNTKNQVFQVACKSGTLHYIKVVDTDKVLTMDRIACYSWLQGGGLSQQTRSDNNDRQIFKLESVGSGVYKFLDRYNHSYLTVNSGDCNVFMEASRNDSTQQFKLTPADTGSTTPSITLPSGVYYIHSALGTALDTSNMSMATNGVNAITWTPMNCVSQQWTFEKTGNNYFIKSALGTYLDVSTCNNTSGSNVHLWQKHGGLNQQWVLEKTADGYYHIRTALGNSRLDVSNGSKAAGANVQIFAPNASNAQKWKLYRLENNVKANKTYYIQSCLGNVLDVDGASKSDGANAHTWTLHGGQNQQWILKDAGNGYYYIMSELGTYLDVSDCVGKCGANVHMWTFHGRTNQKWKLESAGSGFYFIKSALGNCYLDVASSGTALGTNVHGWTKNGTAAQKWRFLVQE